MARQYSLKVNDLLQYVRINKCAYDDIEFQKNPLKDTVQYKSNLIYNQDTGEIIQGASVVFRSTRTPAFTQHSFDLRVRYKNIENIVLQIEVLPYNINRPTHRENGKVIYGSHLLKATETTEYLPNDWTWYQWLKEFERQSNLTYHGTIVAPYEGELF